MVLKRLTSLNKKGDTIVEVLIVLAILGFAISIAYATANRNLLDTRQAEENAQATRSVQTQIEDLRSMAPLGSITPSRTGIFAQNTKFCITSGTTISTTAAACGILPFYNLWDYNCDLFTAAPCSIGSGGAKAGTNTFIVRITWPDVSGEGTDSVTQAYRARPQS